MKWIKAVKPFPKDSHLMQWKVDKDGDVCYLDESVSLEGDVKEMFTKEDLWLAYKAEISDNAKGLPDENWMRGKFDYWFNNIFKKG